MISFHLRNKTMLLHVQLLNSVFIKFVYIRTKYPQNLHNNMSGTVVHFMAWPTQALCSNLEHQTKRLCSLFVVVARLILSHLTTRIAVANDDL